MIYVSKIRVSIAALRNNLVRNDSSSWNFHYCNETVTYRQMRIESPNFLALKLPYLFLKG
jgi:hypothetical protein